MYNLKQRNTKKQGDVGLGLAIAYFSSRGYTVCIPLTDSQDYDLIIEEDNELKKVQVKTTTEKRFNGDYYLGLRVTGGNRSGRYKIKDFNNEIVDYVFAISPEHQYLIPTKEIRYKTGFCLNSDRDKYKVL